MAQPVVVESVWTTSKTVEIIVYKIDLKCGQQISVFVLGRTTVLYHHLLCI